ncbi:MAG: hypothetical protein KBD21_04460 [Candidatus Pacebacteria bacterium]|nr:hypothetical protein [Candidatus Paceibacterota bacterium]
MRIGILTPLFPPDVEEPAPYVKELSGRLGKEHEVTVLLYGHLPESVSGVTLLAIDKRTSILRRMFAYTRTLYRLARNVEMLFVENGPSVELPALLVHLTTGTPYILHEGDPRVVVALSHSNPLRTRFARAVRTHAHAIITDSPKPRQEILPFTPRPATELATFKAEWEKHLKEVVHKLQTSYVIPAKAGMTY